MASNSNSSLALVTSSTKNYYDVFVTFRGEDTRNNFTDFLFDALETKGIMVFRDDINLQKGESIGPELIRAIEGSQVFVVVFSKNYASSTWCLQELEKIFECVQGSKKHVLPVFYDVDPSNVRKQSEIYREAFVKHEQRFQQDFEMVSRWREALKQVGSISGWDLRDKPQAGELKKIVQRIINILKCKSSCVSKDLVGVDSPIEALQNHLLLNSVDGVRAIGICGMGGIGKTTLAMALYDQIRHQFSASCFIDDVTEECKLLHHAKALLIIDSVDQVEQLEKLAVHRKWLGAGSIIVIISRYEHILKEYRVDVVYKVPLLNRPDSYKLFCRKAFKSEKIIMSNDQNLTNEILSYANGLPLAIKVLGSFLFGRNVTEWKSALARLRGSPHKNVKDVLQLSFDGLEETVKEILLDIACFFNSWPEKRVKNILNCCGFHADIGLRVLIDKSLISIDHLMRIEMHSLLKELGRKIVQEYSSKEQRKWSRLWSKKQISNVRMKNMEKDVEAIVLNDAYDECDEHLSKMSNLRLLIISKSSTRFGRNFSDSPSCLSNELRYVEWYGYPFNFLPTSFHPNELVELILTQSKIKQLWTNKKYLPKLRRLDLRDSRNLEKIRDFGEFPNLERLNLEGCVNLVELDPSIGLLRKLVYLNLERCRNLVQLHPSIGLLRKLVYLNLNDCCNLVGTPNMTFNLSSLEELRMRDCFKVFSLPSLGSLYCLREVDISFCNISQVPHAIECLHSLERLNLGGNNFVTLPSLRKLSKLVYLNLENCNLLESLSKLPFPTTTGPERDEIDEMLSMTTKITGLFICNCPKLGERECYSSMTLSWMIQFIRANPQSSDKIQIVTPGSEIPSWINNQSMGSSITIEESPIMQENNNNMIGFVCCAVISLSPKSSDVIELVINNISNTRVNIRGHLITTKSSHLWIIYLPGESLSYCSLESICFPVDDDSDDGTEVKSCGYRWASKQDLQEFNLPISCFIGYSWVIPGVDEIDTTTGDVETDLAIEDETQPQPEQESFTSQGITTSQRRKSTNDNMSTAKTISIVNRKRRNKSRTSISATETEVSVEVPDSPVADEVSPESPQEKISSLHIIGRFIGRILNNCCQQGSTDTDTDTVNSDAESLVSEENLDDVNSIIGEDIQTDNATSNVETDSPVDQNVIERKKLQLQLRQTAM